MNLRQRYDLVLSISLTTRGFAHIVFEGPHTPVDWSVYEARGPKKNDKCIQKLTALLKHFRPDVLIMENVMHPSSHRSGRVRHLSLALCSYADSFGVPVMQVSRDEIRDAFAPQNASTKDEIAQVIAEELPVLLRYLPPSRKPWMSEDARMGLFDAAALYLSLALGPSRS